MNLGITPNLTTPSTNYKKNQTANNNNPHFGMNYEIVRTANLRPEDSLSLTKIKDIIREFNKNHNFTLPEKKILLKVDRYSSIDFEGGIALTPINEENNILAGFIQLPRPISTSRDEIIDLLKQKELEILNRLGE